MVFSSAVFCFLFLPVFLFGNFIIRENYRNFWLLIASIIFYSWAQPQFLWILFVNIIIDYAAGRLLDKLTDIAYKRIVLITTILLNVGLLVYFKYFIFLISTFNSITGMDFTLPEIALPIGISFYTFKSISYIADVYTGKIEAEKNIVNIAIYISMFPQILSGPIDNYCHLKNNITKRILDSDLLKNGIEKFIIGIFEKVVIANSLGVIVDDIWSLDVGGLTWKMAWFASIIYTLQIFFDFAGYSNMAIGIGKMIGFDFSENFNYPYVSKSVTEFWRRWHITLGVWFKNYIYIPLGGNRNSRLRTYINLAIVFLVTGIWHGASWTFILWGILHGVFRLLEKWIEEKKVNLHIPNGFKNLFAHAYLILVVNFGWVLFRAPDIKEAIKFIKSMFGVMSSSFCGISTRYYLSRWNVFVVIIAIVISSSLPIKINTIMQYKLSRNTYIIIKDCILILLLLISVMGIVTETYNSFIYFQF